jgi:hypothetical protein
VHLLTKEEAGIQTDLPRGTVSGYAAEQMTEEDEDEHEPAGRVDGDPRSSAAAAREGPARRVRSPRCAAASTACTSLAAPCSGACADLSWRTVSLNRATAMGS